MLRSSVYISPTFACAASLSTASIIPSAFTDAAASVPRGVALIAFPLTAPSLQSCAAQRATTRTSPYLASAPLLATAAPTAITTPPSIAGTPPSAPATESPAAATSAAATAVHAAATSSSVAIAVAIAATVATAGVPKPAPSAAALAVVGAIAGVAAATTTSRPLLATAALSGSLFLRPIANFRPHRRLLHPIQHRVLCPAVPRLLARAQPRRSGGEAAARQGRLLSAH